MHPLRTPESDIRKSIHMFDREGAWAGPISMPTSPSDVTGGGDPVEDPVSYARDFAPLTRKFFNASFNSGMAPRRAAESFFAADAMIKQAYAGNAQLRGMDEQSRLRRVQYESSVFALESARDKARKEREMMESLVPVQDELNSILEDPNTDAAAKRRALGIYGVRNSAVLGTNPLAAGAYSAAQRGVLDNKAKFTAKDFFNASQGLGGDFLKEEAARRGVESLNADDEIDFNRATSALQTINTDYAKNKATSAQTLRDESSARRRLSDTLNKVHSIELVPEVAYDDPDTKKRVVQTPAGLKDTTDMATIDRIIAMGTAEEQRAAQGASAETKLFIAKGISAEIGLGTRRPSGTKAEDMVSKYKK